MKIIWLLPIFAATVSTLLATSSAVRLRITTMSASPPAAMTARAESYSQLVPGNTGISTLGLATLTAGASVDTSELLKVGTVSSVSTVLVG